jgi:hypothetical protein
VTGEHGGSSRPGAEVLHAAAPPGLEACPTANQHELTRQRLTRSAENWRQRHHHIRRENMRKPLRQLAALVLLALIAMIFAGYWNAAAKTGVVRSGSANAAAHEMALKYAQCMRDHGVSEFPNPDPSGPFTIDGVVNGSSLDTDSAAWKKAVAACKNLEPSGYMGYKRSPQQQEIALKFAQCIRDNGVNDFPNPGPDDPLVDTNRIPSAATKAGMSMLEAAMHNCGATWGDRLGLER